MIFTERQFKRDSLLFYQIKTYSIDFFSQNMRAQPPTAFTQNDVDQTSTYLCYLGSAEVCVWVMFVLIIAASVKIGYIRHKLPSTSTGIQGAVNFFGMFSLPFSFRRLLHLGELVPPIAILTHILQKKCCLNFSDF